MDSCGICPITGRLKDMIIRRGENIYPREIGEVLYTQPAVSDVAVVSIPNDYWGKAIAAMTAFKPNAAATSDSLKSHVQGSLARYKVPSVWNVLEEIPTTAFGKLQNFKLVDIVKAGEFDNALMR